MNAFQLRHRLIQDYSAYVRSFIVVHVSLPPSLAVVDGFLAAERAEQRGRNRREGARSRSRTPTVIPIFSQGYTRRVPLGCHRSVLLDPLERASSMRVRLRRRLIAQPVTLHQSPQPFVQGRWLYLA